MLCNEKTGTEETSVVIMKRKKEERVYVGKEESLP